MKRSLAEIPIEIFRNVHDAVCLMWQPNYGAGDVGCPHGVLEVRSEQEAAVVAPLWRRAVIDRRRLLRNPWRLASKTRKQERRRQELKQARDTVLAAARHMVAMEGRQG